MDAAKIPELRSALADVSSSNYVTLREHETIAEALKRLRSDELAERIVYFYVVDEARRLIGVVPTRRLLLSAEDRRISEIMIHPVVAVQSSQSFKDALKIMLKRKFLALPVVDIENRIVGVVDLVGQSQDIVHRAHTGDSERLFQFAGIHIDEAQAQSFAAVIRQRFPWLVCNIASGIGAAFLAALISGLLARVVALSFFIPLVLTLAESIAIQALTLSLRRAELGDAVPGELPGRRTLREVRHGLVLGLCASLLVAGLIAFWLGDVRLAFVMLVSVTLAGGVGALLGYGVPRMVYRLKLDPKIASGPAVLAAADLGALALYFGSALMLL